MQIIQKLIWTAGAVLLSAALLQAETLDAPPGTHPSGSMDPASAAAMLMPKHDYSELESLLVQNGGRKKPMLTFARESLLTISGRSTFEIADGVKVEPMPFIISIWLSGRDWSTQPMIVLDYAPLKEELGLPVKGGPRFSFQEIVNSPAFADLYEEMEKVRSEQGAEAFTELQEKLSDLSQRLSLFRSLQAGSAFTVVPHPSKTDGDWLPIPEGHRYYSDEAWAAINRETIHLFAAYHGEPIEKDFVASARDFRQMQWNLAPEVMPATGVIRAEVIYEHFHFFRWAWILCLLSGMAVSISWLKFQRPGFILASLLASGAVALLVIGMGLRVYISGRAPVTNMYETVIWVGFGVLLFSLIFELRYKCRYYLASGAPAAGVFLILADSVPAILDPNIAPLTAVLRDNFWLTTHVLTVTISYAAFALAFALGHVVLAKQIFRGGKMGDNKFLYAYIYRAMQVGILLLTAGVILGGVWANYSWGRFWGWDPKETWSLIAILCYLFVLHGRLVGWWKGFGMTVGSVIGFLSVLMCWYGVNFILGAGLHSYGFGAGGTHYVIGFVVAEVLFVAVAIFRRYQSGTGASSSAASVTDAQAEPPVALVGQERGR
jgi:cytochrome c-type biogenesis protein CcsB